MKSGNQPSPKCEVYSRRADSVLDEEAVGPHSPFFAVVRTSAFVFFLRERPFLARRTSKMLENLDQGRSLSPQTRQRTWHPYGSLRGDRRP